MRIHAEYTKEYYNPHFTEFDINKWMLQIDLNHQSKKRHQTRLYIAHGNADNITYGSLLQSTSFDRSYVFDKIRTEYRNKRSALN